MIAFFGRFCHNDGMGPIARFYPLENMPMPLHPWSAASLLGPICLPALLLLSLAPGQAAGDVAATDLPAVEELRLETSDGIRIAGWYYPSPGDARAYSGAPPPRQGRIARCHRIDIAARTREYGHTPATGRNCS